MRISTIFVLVIVFFVRPAAAQQTWQSALESKFDIVETFDQLQDWTGHAYGDVPVTDNPNEMPKKTDGTPSIWKYYSNWGSTTSTKKWIGDHGSANNWKGTGKSLCIDYTSDLGPGRLGFHIGSAPSDGYQSEAYVFFMNKYPQGFFPMNGTQFLFFGYLKTFEIATGFREVFNWGTPDQQQRTVNAPQQRNVYGLNDFVMNFHGDGALTSQYNVFTAALSSEGDTYEQVYASWWDSADLSSVARSGEWFGIEYRFKRSNPPGATNGGVEVWLYRQDGTVFGHGLLDNIVNFKSGSVSLADHAYNKFVWGGNRFEPDFSGRTDGHASDPAQGHAYIDDVIVHKSRIGPTYFTLINAPTDTTPPAAPKGLRAR